MAGVSMRTVQNHQIDTRYYDKYPSRAQCGSVQPLQYRLTQYVDTQYTSLHRTALTVHVTMHPGWVLAVTTCCPSLH